MLKQRWKGRFRKKKKRKPKENNIRLENERKELGTDSFEMFKSHDWILWTHNASKKTKWVSQGWKHRN